MECFNLIYAHLSVQYHDVAHLSVCIYLINIPEPVLYEIYTLDFPFDLRCESVTYNYIYIYIYIIYIYIIYMENVCRFVNN